VKLDSSGDPIHTRTLGVALLWRADGRLDLRGQLLDLRKRGCVPVAGGLQGSGLIHHMRVHGVIDPATRRLDEIGSLQPTVAFEPGPRTRGESCRDPAARVAALAGGRGLALRAGVATELLRRLSGDPGQQPLLAALLQMTPAAQQCLAALEGAWQVAARQAKSDPAAGVGVGSFPDSCYMWRRGGALDALRGGRSE